MRGRILVVDDEPLKRITLQIELSELGFEVFEAADALAARRIFDSKPIDIVVSDVRLPGANGLDLLAHIKQARPDVGVILMTAYASVDTAVQAIKGGAYDYITKPFTTQELVPKLERLLAVRSEVPRNEEVEQLSQLVAVSQSMKRLFAQVRAVADTDRTILLCGESGTGKELFAEAIHDLSRRADKPFVRFSCAALQASVLESELFGHEKGAFTGAIRQKPGRFELAHTGTILLDEVDDIPVEIQVKLLRVVEQQEFERVGGETPVHVDVRLLCATKCDLLKLVKEGRFREDLYYRLNVISLAIPPLRERPDDIPLLARHFLKKHAALTGDRVVTISPAALDQLLRHNWPGNVRELEHVMERALAFCGGHEIRPEHITAPVVEATEPVAWAAGMEPPEGARPGLTDTLSDIERRMILLALRQCDNNQVRAAQRLGIPRTTLRDKMAKYKIPGGC
ncbi:MAG: sigma-54-dependent Fis family transcriptional regulator [Phycisphaerae bacterium]|jgi:DNA-binding NtrC family response regulator|nr:sigma-54-dependent Fis family transcriptional regulator [Phycisphaerae bacterium]HOO16370.1 sigma-54 dependent transcriptional regulator [Phycisphaerae bacterium]HPC22063.1 sigma-54 dependent transcriptional regulator [Phycisphaerae bacterium]HRS27102.1 sigma-54 dependent transcriptional regulator [Phycisphaerae bacterium]HRT40711.1 sigma-54 dependent transcriptional regulator [Phycisphaerae bacterium]